MDGKETRKEYILRIIRLLWNVELNEEDYIRDEFRFEGCDGIKCPTSCSDCKECKFKGFWEGDVDERL